MTIFGAECDCLVKTQTNFSKESFMVWVVRLLMQLAETMSSVLTPVVNAAIDTMTTVLPAAISAAYALAVDLPDSTREVTFDNQTDGDVVVSMDGGATDSYYIVPGQVRTINFYSIGRLTSAVIHVKDGTVASTTGQFLIYAMR